MTENNILIEAKITNFDVVEGPKKKHAVKNMPNIILLNLNILLQQIIYNIIRF